MTARSAPPKSPSNQDKNWRQKTSRIKTNGGSEEEVWTYFERTRRVSELEGLLIVEREEERERELVKRG
jgi:hypothetical protein